MVCRWPSGRLIVAVERSGAADMGSDQKLTGSPTVGDRRWAIVHEVQRLGWVSVNQLKQLFDLSEVSIRRDLEYLDRQGLVQRVHGGAQAVVRTGQMGLFQTRLLHNVEAKRAVAEAAVGLIRPGDRLLLDSGTTVLEVARAIPRKLKDTGELTVMTRSLAIASELRDERNIRLFLLGGVYAPDYDTLVGTHVERALKDIHVDKLIMGADGVVPERGLTSDNVLEVNLFRSMVDSAEQVIVVSDSSKIGSNYLQTVLSFESVHVFVTDSGAPAGFQVALRERGIEVIVAPLSKTAEGGPG